MRRKKILAMALALVMTGSLIAQAREYTPFTDVPEGSRFYEEVKLCYESGLLNGTTETTFTPQGSLSIAQLIVMSARLYHIQDGGDGTIPALPDFSKARLRMTSENDLPIRTFKLGEDKIVYNAAGEGVFIQASEKGNDLSLPERCTLSVGFEDYDGELFELKGTRESHPTAAGLMSQGLTGTGYRFDLPDGFDMDTALRFLSQNKLEDLEKAWWLPAAFYLACQEQEDFVSGLLERVNPDGGAYSLVAGFREPASRNLFAWLLDLTVGDDLEIKHESVSVPDVNLSGGKDKDAPAILRLYREGILSGVDDTGRFNGAGTLNRGQAAAMLARVLNPDLRV